MHDQLRSRVETLFPSLVELLEDLIRIPSVSAAGYPPGEVRRSAERVAAEAERIGFTDVRLLEIDGAHPAVYGEIPGPDDAPTVLLYAHHDVQPPGPVEEWTTAPFEPFTADGRLHGRGASDDKAGIIMHLGAVTALDGRPPVGIKLFVEGEEEIGSSHLGAFLDEYADLLAADVIVIGDAGNWAVGKPALTTSLRGLVSARVDVKTAEAPVHSGLMGGLFPDALTTLARLLATLHNPDGSVAVEGLVTGDDPDVDLPEAEAREQMGAVPGLHLLGSGSLTGRLWNQASISVLAIDAPPIAEAINQLVPSASAKVSMRIPPGQDPDAAANALRSHLLDHIPWGAELTVTLLEAGSPFSLPSEGVAYEKWRSAMQEAWGVAPVEMGVGGSIPFVAAFADRYPEATILLTGAGDPTSSVHAPNESQHLDDLERAVLAEAIALATLTG